MPTRLTGIGLLAICAFAAARLHALATAAPRHPPSVAEMVLSLAAILTGLAGSLAAIVGHAFFEPIPWPRRSRPD
ncbi:MAG TPA: hypothetical protein VFW19_17265 [Allosphingosinicella sp.]|nr:hypothetical protein [Allosphingosinicella sp.]